MGCRLASPRHGFLFHGSNLRYDAGARGAVRDWAPHLNTSFSFQVSTVTRTKQHAFALALAPSLPAGGEIHPPWGCRPSPVLCLVHWLQGLVLAKLPSQDSSRSTVHALHRTVSQHTTTAMLDASICFAPRGDTDTSRRLFDALATVRASRAAATYLGIRPY